MKARLIVVVGALATLILLTGGAAVAQDEDIAVDAAYKAAIIDTVCTALNKAYIFEDVAQDIERALRRHVDDGDYDAIQTLRPFVDRLTEDIKAVAHDEHIWVKVPPEEELRIARGEATPEESDPAARGAWQNYGFTKLERMQENVGYLEMGGFYDATYAGPTAIAAMNFLAHSDVIIIDLRYNGGGNPSMIQLLSSYFFDEPTHLNSFYVRENDETVQFWTQASVEGPRMTDTPLYILTSRYTFSAAEEFAYNMKHMGRATIIGEVTRGGAHPNDIRVFPDLVVAMSIPYGRAINPITKTNWERVGVKPDIEASIEEALDVATIEALRRIERDGVDDTRAARIAFTIGRLEALRNPVEVAPTTLQKWAGAYGPRSLFMVGGQLWYQREGRPRHRLVPASDTTFYYEDIDYFKLEVETDEAGNAVALVGHYNDGREDRSPRNTD